MAQESLLQRLEYLASRVRSLEQDKKQAAATIEALERAERQAAANIEAFEHAERQAAATIQELELEKKQAAVTIRGLERQVAELGALITQATAKVDEILNDGAIADIPQPTAVNMPIESNGLDRLEGSSAPQTEPKQRFGKSFRFD